MKQLRLVFVNHVHPASGLVAGLRLWRFAEELAKRGHRIVFLTEGIPGEGLSPELDLAALLDTHDWCAPLLVPCGQVREKDRHRSGNRGNRIRAVGELSTAASVLFMGGVFWRWRHAAERNFETISRHFRPHLAYATFGNLDALNIARRLSGQCGAPWVMDIKDPLPQFVPRPFWPLVRRRYSDAAAVTFNSEFQRRANISITRTTGLVVYSGADTAGGEAVENLASALLRGPIFNLIGSVHSDNYAFEFLSSFGDFAAARKKADAPSPVLRYFGGDHDRIRRLLPALGWPPNIMVRSQIPRLELLALCRTAHANCYLASERTFHHKLFELLAAGRPVIAYPMEREESLRIAVDVDATFHVCRTPSDLAKAWQSALTQKEPKDNSRIAAQLGWPRFAAELEHLFMTLLETASEPRM